jgi:hypothetical protein
MKEVTHRPTKKLTLSSSPFRHDLLLLLRVLPLHLHSRDRYARMP